MYAAYTSPHWPLQVPDDELDRYAGVYDAGYDALREKNFAALQQSGMVDAELTLRPRNPAVRPWDELDPEQQRRESRKMELYAAMVENLDDHVGRLLQYLKDEGEYDNTMVVFMGDNGADGLDLGRNGPYVDYIQANYSMDFEDWGRKDGWVTYNVPWAEAGSAPFKLFKTYTSEGGIVAPMVVSGAGVEIADEISHSYLTVMDLAPTFLEMGGASYPDDPTVKPLLGASLTPLLRGEADAVHNSDYVTVMYHNSRALVRKGDYKLVAIDMPFAESKFELYDLASDPAETADLSESHPEKRDEMLEIWRQQRTELGIVVPEDL